MTRTEPLTSLALGRSPYDDVVQGEGEADSRAPSQMYDERGRPINPEARRLNRELIRAHNEVMLAIGVAEPDDSAIERLEAQRRAFAKCEADAMGTKFWIYGRAAIDRSVWGLLGLRQRILVYKQYSSIPFAYIWDYERRRRSIPSLFLSGLPASILDIVAGPTHCWGPRPPPPLDSWIPYKWPHRLALYYVSLHLNIFVVMQRLEIISPNAWLPGPLFFVPFTSSSPITKPPPLRSLYPRDILGWIGGVAMSIAPTLVYAFCQHTIGMVRMCLWHAIYDELPRPINPSNPPLMLPQPRFQNQQQTHQHQQQQQQPSVGQTGWTSDGTPRADSEVLGSAEPHADQQTTQHRTARRQSTISSLGRAGDGQVSDEDDEDGAERVFATLIHIEREPPELNSDVPPGVWSAELRPNIPNDTSGAGASGNSGEAQGQPEEEIKYNTNSLTLVPAKLAADAMANVAVNILMLPLDAFSLRVLARSLWRRQPGGLGVLLDVYGLMPWADFTWRGLGSVFLLELMQWIVQADTFLGLSVASDAVRSETEA